MEITLRYGWCCDPFPLPNNNDSCINKPRVPISEPVTASKTTSATCIDTTAMTDCLPYRKADFSGLAALYGLHYYYYDPAYTTEIKPANLIDRKAVYVNAVHFAKTVKRLWLKYYS